MPNGCTNQLSFAQRSHKPLYLCFGYVEDHIYRSRIDRRCEGSFPNSWGRRQPNSDSGSGRRDVGELDVLYSGRRGVQCIIGAILWSKFERCRRGQETSIRTSSIFNVKPLLSRYNRSATARAVPHTVSPTTANGCGLDKRLTRMLVRKVGGLTKQGSFSRVC